MERIKTVILCGGKGTRLERETEFRPKPMVEVGGKPILWHIMKIYAHYGFKEFVLCLGYKGEIIKNYYLNYLALNCDFTIELDSRNFQIHQNHSESNWVVTLTDTGLNAMTGARIKRIEKYIDTANFMVTYGDGVADVDINQLVEFHKGHGKIGTLTGAHPPSRFGEMIVKNNRVTEFLEKPKMAGLRGVINGGFFVFKRDFFNYLQDNDGCILEKEPLENLARDGELIVYHHNGFWQCMDTQRDLNLLNEYWDKNEAKWKVWE